MSARVPSRRRALLAVCSAVGLAAVFATGFGADGPLAVPAVRAAANPPARAATGPSVVLQRMATIPRGAPVRPSATWTSPRLAGSGPNCYGAVAGIDANGRYHIAANCGDPTRIYYWDSKANGTWERRNIAAPPAGRMEVGPVMAFSGNKVYLAYTRVAIDQGCGGGFPDLGVYYRTRTLPSGAWSGATKIGLPKDGLAAFRIAGGKIHATVLNDSDSKTYYETVKGTALHRYSIPGGQDAPAMRIGSDGKARVAYRTSAGIRYGTFSSGGALSSRLIAGSVPDDYAPILVLDSANKAHVLWQHSPFANPGCAVPDGTPHDGTYYGTNRTGTWHSSRVTVRYGETALAVSDSTHRAHILVSNGTGLRYYSGPEGGPWTTKVLTTASVMSPLILLRQSSGALLVVYLRDRGSNSTGIYVMTKG
jgi:hypothetical protein